MVLYENKANPAASNSLGLCIECFHSRGQHLCKFLGTKGSVCIRKEINSQRIVLGHHHGRRFIVLGHQYGHRDVMWKHSIKPTAVIGLLSSFSVYCFYLQLGFIFDAWLIQQILIIILFDILGREVWSYWSRRDQKSGESCCRERTVAQ